MSIKKSFLQHVRTYLFIIPCICVVILSGCGRVTDWMDSNIKQVGRRSSSSIPCEHIKSITRYDQFSTVAMFDALWLSDAVRTIYSDLHNFKQGKSIELSNAFLRRQLEENKHFISFYVLAPYDVSLNEKNSPWSVSLEIDGDLFAPIETKIIELAPEFQSFFGKRLSRFKAAHLLKFNAKDVEEKPLITARTQAISLLFRSVDREVSLTWPLIEGKLAIGERVCTSR